MHVTTSRFAFAIVLFSLQFGCSSRQKELTSGDEKLIPVYAELLVLSEELKAPRPALDSAAYQSQVQAILSRNGLTKQGIADRIMTLAQSQELFSQFQTRVHSELEQRKSKLPK
jgi:hypothetical protein